MYLHSKGKRRVGIDSGHGGRGCAMVGGTVPWWEGVGHGGRGWGMMGGAGAYDSPKLEDCRQIF